MQDIANIVRTHKDINLGRDIAGLVEIQEYKQCEDFGRKMNMELSLIEGKVPDEAKPIYKIRVKIAMLRGVEAFGEPAKFLQWIDKQTKVFGNESWRSLLLNSAGLEKILDAISRVI